MLIIPAIDIKNGICVRLRQGRMEEETVYSFNPVDVARRWESSGASLIHVVDLDAAISGMPKNLEIIKKIASSIKASIQIGGGIRDMESARVYLGIPNVKRVVLGTIAYENPDIIKSLSKNYPGKIAVAIDAKGGMVAIKGWTSVTDRSAMELAKKIQDLGVSSIIYTDIMRDGMLSGPNIESIKELVGSVDIPVIASGGVATMEDIRMLKTIRIEGVIIGKALYSGAIDIKEALKEC